MWALADPLRFASEIATLAAIGSSLEELTIGDPRLVAGGQIAVDFDVNAGGRTFEAVLTYPDLFPAVPPTVRPRSAERWSGHQYGSGGELCLEWGPDNWEPEITGAAMVESALNLLSTEAGDEVVGSADVPSRHDMSLGQELRGEGQRLIVTGPLEDALSGLDADVDAQFSIRFGKPTWLAYVTSMTRGDGEWEWAEPSVPLPVIEEGRTLPGRVLVGLDRMPKFTGPASDLRVRMFGVDPVAPASDEILLCVAKDGSMSAAYLYNSKDSIFPIKIVPAKSGRSRLPIEHAVLATKRVAVIGCGSLGSKVAISLARAGVGGFLLVDDDVLLPGNLVRNELTWSDVGEHKVDAVERRLRLISSDVRVTVKRQRLGGQESNGSLDGLVKAIADCDLIIDATADARAFNYAAAAAGRKTPMVWADIFGGGFGGHVARSRPGIDPSPQRARSLIEVWCKGHEEPQPAAGNDYAAVAGGELPMVADDTSVGLIASVATSMVIDCLIGREPSRFSASAYMIGMAGQWIFERPLDTWPIDLGPGAADEAAVDYSDPKTIEALCGLVALVQGAKP